MSSHPKIRAVATAPTAAELEGPARDLVVAMLKMVPVDVVLEVLTDQVRTANRAEPLVAALTLQGDLEKPKIQQRSGPSLSTEEAGKLLRVSSETVRSRIARKSLVGYGAPGDRTRVRLPRWQFDGNGEVHAWVPRLVAAFGGSGWGLLDFVTVPRSTLDGGNYLHLLLNGRADEVIAAALRSNPD